jgi:WD40 repeat protein
MLNYSVKVGNVEEEVISPLNVGQEIGTNPFPGLRPFTIDEAHLFFGREGQVDEIISKLYHHHCVTVMGYSGSGKSSLMYCGVVPVLMGGLLTRTSSSWQIISSRPGSSPIENLANALIAHLVDKGRILEADVPIHRAIILSILRSGTNGLVEVAKYLQTQEGENVFLLVDQFEEIFRYRDSTDERSVNESTAYVNLLLEAVHQREVPFYLSLNMRSDFIGDCAAFSGLTQMINESNYLVPQMTRENKRLAIEGPIAVAGGQISERLIKRLLVDLGDNQDQLPILQHALMRTWDYWVNNREENEPIDLRHYNAIGKIGQALSQHANEAYDELTLREREIAEVLFKTITEKNLENQGLRRPGKIRLIAELSEATERDVIQVVEQFRKPGRSFLMPGTQVALTGESVVEVSHESFMRIWNRLSGWVDEEFESAQMYKRLSDAAAMYQIGKTGLWRPPDLQLALNWQKKQRPTRTWAQRYNEAFERAIVFLDTSRITYEAELKNQEMLQRRLLRRARVVNIILGAFLLLAVGLFFYGLTQQIEAQKNEAAAKLSEAEAQKSQKQALESAAKEKERSNELQLEKEKTEQFNKELQQAFDSMRLLRNRAQEALNVAEQQTRFAEEKTVEANKSRDFAEQQTRIAKENLETANRLYYLQVAQTIAGRSENIDDKDLAGTLAMQGYLFHTKFSGKKYDPYIFRGLYYALTKLSGLNYNALKTPGNYRNLMFALAVSKKNNEFFTTGNDGRIFRGGLASIQETEFAATPNRNRVLALSPDEDYLAVASDSASIQLFEVRTGKSTSIKGHQRFVNDLEFLPDGRSLVSVSGDFTVRINDITTGKSSQFLTLPYELKAIDLAPDGKTLYGASPKGKVVTINLETKQVRVLVDEAPNRVLSIAVHPTQNMIAYGIENINEKGIIQKGTVKLLDLASLKTRDLTGHKSGIADLEFSADGQLLASAGLDRKLQMWVVDHPEDLPIVMDNNNGNIWDVAFTSDSRFLLASCNSGEIRVWPTDSRSLAEQVCPKVSRNMTPEEWSLYVAENIDYENTCKSLLISDY